MSRSPFQQVGHEPPRLARSQRLGSLGLAALVSTAIAVAVIALWWLWLSWARTPAPREGPIPLILDADP